jgi:hypothetical protein
MFLRSLLALAPMLLLSDAGDAGTDAPDSTDQGDTTPTGREPDSQHASDGREPSKPEPSANKLIKDFVKQQGITVEDLISEYTTLKDGQKTEFQRLEGERDTYRTKAEELEQRYRSAVASSAVKDAASAAGAISPKAVYALIRDDVEFDDNGEPTNIADLIAQAQQDEPQLFRASGGSGDGGRGGNGHTPSDINSVFRQIAQNAH